MGDVIDFKRKKEEEPDVDGYSLDLADDIVEEIIDEIDAMFETYGIDRRDEYFAKNLYFTMEALRSLVYGHIGAHHAFQRVADKMITAEYDPTEDAYSVSWNQNSELDTGEDPE